MKTRVFKAKKVKAAKHTHVGGKHARVARAIARHSRPKR